MKKSTFIATGITLFLGCLWGGPFVYSLIPLDHWARIPTAMTASMGCIIGVFVTAFGAFNLEDMP